MADVSIANDVLPYMQDIKYIINSLKTPVFSFVWIATFHQLEKCKRNYRENQQSWQILSDCQRYNMELDNMKKDQS
jgi:hypothetical protein